MGQYRASAASAGRAIGAPCESREERAHHLLSSRAQYGVRRFPPSAGGILALENGVISMHVRSFLGSSGALLALTTALSAATPDDPGAPAPPARYSPVTSGTKTYRPVEPLPWGDINRRVTPQPKQAPADRDKTMPDQTGPKHKH